MRVTAILNLKGGVAKTTTTVNMAAILARDYRKRVLVVDADSQCNTTEFLQAYTPDSTLADGLRGKQVNPLPTKLADVSLIAADDSLMDLDLSSIAGDGLDVKCLVPFKSYDEYDYMLVDCPPAFNAATAAALLAADDVVIPIKLDAFSLRGMANLLRQVSNMKKLNPALCVAGLLPTMSYKNANLTKSIDTLHQMGLPVYSGIRRTSKVDDMTYAQEPLIISSPKSAACVDYKRFVAEYVGGVK